MVSAVVAIDQVIVQFQYYQRGYNVVHGEQFVLVHIKLLYCSFYRYKFLVFYSQHGIRAKGGESIRA